MVKHTIEEIKELARAKGGECLSDKYISTRTKLTFKCSKGHIWEAIPQGILYTDTWCRVCAGHVVTLEDLQKIAAERGGECLSNEYEGHQIKLLWRCSRGHEWLTTPSLIKQGKWCPQCYAERYGRSLIKYAIEDMRSMAAQRGGECLSSEYINSTTKLLWRCKHGHEFYAHSASVRSGRWCKKCAGVANAKIHRKHTIEEMRGLAAERGGECLSNKYVNTLTKLRWRCSKGHEWRTAAQNILYRDQWCPICCKIGYREGVFRNAIENITGRPFHSIRPAWLRNRHGYVLEIDGFNEELMLGFEYQGQQHFEYIPRFHGKKGSGKLARQQQNDYDKKIALQERGIKMLYPDYRLDVTKFDSFIRERLPAYSQ